MTSSTDAIVHGHAGPDRVNTEADWSDPGKLSIVAAGESLIHHSIVPTTSRTASSSPVD